jgi:two-component system response regulator HydG
LAKARVLIVDDDIGQCKTMSFVLKRRGYDVVTATSGPESIELARGSLFDVIFLDIKMPVMDGVETYRRIKAISPDAVVVMMTGYAVEDLVQEALREGAYAVLYKPLDMEKVVALVEEARSAKRGTLVLIVDDDLGTCVTLRKILVGKGYEVGTARSGEAAVAMAQERRYEIIMIDLKLPTINGLETYLAIKEINPEVVALMMTAYRQEMEELVEEALNNNAYACLHKPLDMETTLKLLEEIQERKREGK